MHTLTLSLIISPSHTDPSHSLSPVTLSLTCFSILLFSQSISLSVSTISQASPSPKALIKPQQALSLRGLSKLKKKVSCFVPTVQCLVVEKHAWKIKESLVSRSSFLFWFMYWISNKTVNLLKKIKALLFFEIELVCGFDFFCFVLFCALFCSWVELLIWGKFHTQILNYALFCSDDVRVC